MIAKSLPHGVGYIAGTLAARFPDARIETATAEDGRTVEFTFGYQDRPGSTTMMLTAEAIMGVIDLNLIVDWLAPTADVTRRGPW